MRNARPVVLIPTVVMLAGVMLAKTLVANAEEGIAWSSAWIHLRQMSKSAGPM